MKQINLKLPDNLFKVAERYVVHFGFRNIQDLATEAIREKVFERNEYDENFSKEEVELIDALITDSIQRRDIVSEKELNAILLK